VHGRPSDKAGDPLWVLDGNDRVVLPDASTVPTGYAINTFWRRTGTPPRPGDRPAFESLPVKELRRWG